MSSDKAPQPMDPGAREGASPERVVRNVRHAYAIETLVSEMTAAFGEARATYGEPDDWQVIHEVTFEVTDSDMESVLDRLRHDERVSEVDAEDGQVYVAVWPNRRTRDSRDGFGIAAILEVFREDPVLP